MPILVVCGSCGATLKAPDAAAGNRVKCPSCQSLTAVPMPAGAEAVSDYEFVDPTPVAPAKPIATKPIVATAMPVKAKSKPAVVPDADDTPARSKKMAIVLDDDDEDSDDDTPKKGMKKRKRAKTNPLMFVGLGVVALIAVGFLGVMVWYLAIRGDEVATAETKTKPTADLGDPALPAPGPVLPAGWKKHEKPEFDIAMPESLGVPDYQYITGKKVLVLFFVELPDKKASAGVVVYKLTDEENRTELADPEKAFDAFEKELKTPFTDRKSVELDGIKGREVKGEDKDGKGYMRMYLAHGCRYMFAIQAKDGAEADALAPVFFETIKLKATDKFGSGVPPVVVEAYPKGWTKLEKPAFTAYFADVLGKVRPSTKPDGQRTREQFAAGQGAGYQQLSIVDYGEALFRTQIASRDQVYANAEKAIQAKVLSSKPITVDGAVGRTIMYQDPEGTIGIIALVLAHNRLYTVAITDKGLTEKSPIYKDFIANLKLKSPPVSTSVIPPKPTEPEPEPVIPEDPEVAAHFKKKGWEMGTSTATTGGQKLPKLDVCDPKNPYADIELTDEDYKMIGKAKGVKVLIVQKTKCTDAALKLIAANQTIVSIWVQGDAITDAGLRALTDAKSLTYVNIRGNARMTDAGIGELAKLPKLETLHLLFLRKLDGSCFEKFISAKELRELYVEVNELSNDCAQHVAKLTQVVQLSLLSNGGDLSSAGIKTIVKGHLPYRFSFDSKLLDDELLALLVAKGWLYGPPPPGEKYPRPTKASGVSRINFKFNPITDKGFAVLLDCVNVSDLDLAQTGITDATLLKMGDFKELWNVWFEKCKITGKGLAAIASAPIEFLDVRDCPLDEDAFRAIGKMPKLTELYINGSKAKAPWVQHLAGSTTMRHYMAAETEFDDDSALQLAKIPTLTVVKVPGEKLTDKGFAELVKLPKLESLVLEGKETKVSKEAYLKAKKDYPKKRFYSSPLEIK